VSPTPLTLSNKMVYRQKNIGLLGPRKCRYYLSNK
jgi:hypothetical protein